MTHETSLLIVKLGGSAITRKTGDGSIRYETIKDVATELHGSHHRLLLIYGGGKTAHRLALKYRFNRHPTKRCQRGLTDIKLVLELLGLIIGQELDQAQVANVHICPSSIVRANRGRLHSISLNTIEKAMNMGFLPVLHGDLVPDEVGSFSILSGDTLACELAIRLRPEKVLFGCDVDGIMPTDPKFGEASSPIDEISSRSIGYWANKISETTNLDATGGMARKLIETRTILKAGIEGVIFNLTKHGNLRQLIEGRHILSTKLVP